jgi:large subunit ribosomal protein L27
MAHKKGVGSSKNGRDSQGQRRGVKIYADQAVSAGTIIVRQCGSHFLAGENVGIGKDWTLFAKITGVVKYERVGKDRRRISVVE